jgi:hypothetical protein
MKLRFEVDQAECFRRGIDCPKSIVTVEVNPKDISQEERDLLADHMSGIDVVKLTLASSTVSIPEVIRANGRAYWKTSSRVIAAEPTYRALVAAVQDQAKRESEFADRGELCPGGESPSLVGLGDTQKLFQRES